MKIPYHIGTLESGKLLDLPVDAVTQGFALMGKRGKGKSNLLGVFLEILLDRGQSFVCLDPPAAHWGIRYAAGPDGQPIGPSGFNVLIIGGAHGDIPIEQTNGKEAAQIIVDGDISAVVDMKAMSFGERQKWCADFAEELFRINTTPRMIAFEEAHNFLPQQLKFDEQKRVLYAMGKLIEEGRGSGLGYIIASQKTQKVNKDQLTQVDNFFALGMIGPQDIDQVEGWFKHHIRDKEKLRDVMDDLPKMRAGECWALSPEWLGEITKFNARLRVTYHAGRTPKPGESTVNVDKFSVTEAVKKLRERFAAKQIERRQEVAEMLHELAVYSPQSRTRAQLAAAVGLPKDGSTFTGYLRNIRLSGFIEERGQDISITEAGLAFVGEVRNSAATTEGIMALWRPRFKAKARVMLDYLVSKYPDFITRSELADFAGLPVDGSTFTGYLSNIRLAGLLDERDKEVKAADSLFP